MPDAENDQFIYTLKHYMTPEGLGITELVPVAGVSPETMPRFMATLQAQVGESNGSPIMAQKNVPIEASTIEEAYKMMPEIIKKAGDDMIVEAINKMQDQQRKIVTPSDAMKFPLNGRFSD